MLQHSLYNTICPFTVVQYFFKIFPYVISNSNCIFRIIALQFGYHLIQLEQKGAEIPEPERQQYLDTFESGQMQIFLHDLLTTKYKVVNKLARESPNMPMMVPGQ